ncbi:LysR family transcriptional regulator [uncultured Streptomyces sp.]|uniref:LysR family transcriptional regulator n=1 Tax=uncultured Streptomyces sp. TaxID=174707 RepID=UPI00262096F7|nr:LysR substrate-binding domain-containing protein [uncultured Streptomyces sp.]
MELRQLEYFVAVAEERNFTRAAERVRISQSGVSAQIRRLERELGANLFDRSTRVVALTSAGEAALAHARSVLAAAGSVGRAVTDVTGLVQGRLTVGMVAGCTITPWFDALAAFHAAHPGVELALREDDSTRLADDVRSGAVDLALIGAASTTPEGLDSLTIVSERLVVAVPHGHPLARLPHVTLDDLSAHPVICMPPGTGLRAVFDRACAVRDLRPRIAVEAGAADAIAALAVRGLGAAVLSESMARHYRDHLTARPLTDAEEPALLALVWRARHNPAAEALVERAREAFGVGADERV